MSPLNVGSLISFSSISFSSANAKYSKYTVDNFVSFFNVYGTCCKEQEVDNTTFMPFSSKSLIVFSVFS